MPLHDSRALFEGFYLRALPPYVKNKTNNTNQAQHHGKHRILPHVCEQGRSEIVWPDTTTAKNRSPSQTKNPLNNPQSFPSPINCCGFLGFKQNKYRLVIRKPHRCLPPPAPPISALTSPRAPTSRPPASHPARTATAPPNRPSFRASVRSCFQSPPRCRCRCRCPGSKHQRWRGPGRLLPAPRSFSALGRPPFPSPAG